MRFFVMFVTAVCVLFLIKTIFCEGRFTSRKRLCRLCLSAYVHMLHLLHGANPFCHTFLLNLRNHMNLRKKAKTKKDSLRFLVIAFKKVKSSVLICRQYS